MNALTSPSIAAAVLAATAAPAAMTAAAAPAAAAPTAAADLPRIRYTKGPEDLALGDLQLRRGEWSPKVSNDLAGEALRPGRVKEYGFEAEGYQPPPAAAKPATPTPAPKG